ncbi:hypothetical protein H2248_001364 [Termitomyces sp. 'cryptogamus']|nr:hypothetical protein H2248_001364 [Termitomyces sp. 'cryptogamus']
MAYHLCLAMVAQAAAEPIPEVDLEESSLWEVLSDLTELSTSMGSLYPSAISFQAGSTPTMSTAGPCLVTDRVSHSKKSRSTIAGDLGQSCNEGTIAGDSYESCNKNPGADELQESIRSAAVDTNIMFGTNCSIMVDSMPVSNHKKTYMPWAGDVIEESRENSQTLTPEQNRAIRQVGTNKKGSLGKEDLSNPNEADSRDGLPEKGKSIDSCNWGSLKLPNNELDPALQQLLLSSTDLPIKEQLINMVGE